MPRAPPASARPSPRARPPAGGRPPSAALRSLPAAALPAPGSASSSSSGSVRDVAGLVLVLPDVVLVVARRRSNAVLVVALPAGRQAPRGPPRATSGARKCPPALVRGIRLIDDAAARARAARCRRAASRRRGPRPAARASRPWWRRRARRGEGGGHRALRQIAGAAAPSPSRQDNSCFSAIQTQPRCSASSANDDARPAGDTLPSVRQMARRSTCGRHTATRDDQFGAARRRARETRFARCKDSARRPGRRRPRAPCRPPRPAARPARDSAVARASGDAATRPRSPPARATWTLGEPSLRLESQFMTSLRERTTRRRLEMETCWKQGGLRAGRARVRGGRSGRRRVDFQFPLAAMGTASGAVLVSECTDHSGSPTSAARARGGWCAGRPDAHSREGRRRTSGGTTRARDGGADAGAVARWRWMREAARTGGGHRSTASGGRDGYLRVWRVPRDAVDDVEHAGEEEEVPIRRRRATAAVAAPRKHPNVVSSVTLDRRLLDDLPRRRAAPVARSERRRQVGFEKEIGSRC